VSAQLETTTLAGYLAALANLGAVMEEDAGGFYSVTAKYGQVYLLEATSDFAAAQEALQLLQPTSAI